MCQLPGSSVSQWQIWVTEEKSFISYQEMRLISHRLLNAAETHTHLKYSVPRKWPFIFKSIHKFNKSTLNYTFSNLFYYTFCYIPGLQRTVTGFKRQLCCPNIAHWAFKWSGFFPSHFRKQVTACIIVLNKTRPFLLLQIKSTIQLSSISRQLSFPGFMFLSSHLLPHWHGSTIVQKKICFGRSPLSLYHIIIIVIFLFVSSLLRLWCNSFLAPYPRLAVQVRSDFCHWECEFSSQISSARITEAQHLLRSEGMNAERVCEPPQVTRWADQCERDQKVCGFLRSWARLMSRLGLIWPCGPFSAPSPSAQQGQEGQQPL